MLALRALKNSVPTPRVVPHARTYSLSTARCMPTALARATRAADLRTHPETGVTQEKLPDVKHMHHWEEANATVSEADVRADRESILGIFTALEPERAKANIREA